MFYGAAFACHLYAGQTWTVAHSDTWLYRHVHRMDGAATHYRHRQLPATQRYVVLPAVAPACLLLRLPVLYHTRYLTTRPSCGWFSPPCCYRHHRKDLCCRGKHYALPPTARLLAVRLVVSTRVYTKRAARLITFCFVQHYVRATHHTTTARHRKLVADLAPSRQDYGRRYLPCVSVR